MEDRGLEAQHEFDDNSTGNSVAENASNGANTTPAVKSRDDTDEVNNTGYNGSMDNDGDMDSGGNGNYGGVGDTNAEGASGHSTEGSVWDTSANKCSDGYSNEDGFGDANATREGGNINEDNIGDGTAVQNNTTETEFICASECNNDHWQYVEQPYDGGYAGPNYEQIFEQDVVVCML
ncbi:N66 matrix protein-like [Schistocerca gregaria]|uniref:N66 matrix protein-like n=1 Tax=Schistocerca gregaria TaxID=7010 RepID=UPI00211E0276|nr:N66 matrix protein-like [Schistocerca gregaria]